MSRDDLKQEVRTKQWQQWPAIAADLCTEFGVDEDDLTDSESEANLRVADAENCPPLGTSQATFDEVQTTWRHGNQSYSVAKWSTTEVYMNTNSQPQEDMRAPKRMINCFLKGERTQSERKKLATLEDDDSDEEEEQLMCSMTGQSWESLPFPITIDSGACASVMPSGWCKHVPTQKTQQSEAREYFRAANGSKIYNEGQKSVSMMTREGTWRDTRFTVCDGSKALGSVSQRRLIYRASGHRGANVVGRNKWPLRA